MIAQNELGRFSLGMGDRFARQARAQLQACIQATQAGIEITPVWNKSNREHQIIGSAPESVRTAAEAAVAALGWHLPFFIDADHIRLETVDRFLAASDFFTIDVAESIGKAATSDALKTFTDRHPEFVTGLDIAGIEHPIKLTRSHVEAIAAKYLHAVQEAGKIFRHITQLKAGLPFVAEVSMDETDSPQTPSELLVILATLADEGVPLQTIAPKFTGRFNKGVDYVGDIAQFERELNDDLCVMAFAVSGYGLPSTLKLSVHSGSDKFSIYPAIRRALIRHQAGVHLKTAGTTWLEECIGLAEAGDAGLKLVQEIYRGALEHMDELCAPYATVIDIDKRKLPSPAEVDGWTSEQLVRALRHQQEDPLFNPNLRQLLHVAFKIAARMGSRYLEALAEHEVSVARNVTLNLFERHIKPLFI